jgi:hypothetical protein
VSRNPRWENQPSKPFQPLDLALCGL